MSSLFRARPLLRVTNTRRRQCTAATHLLFSAGRSASCCTITNRHRQQWRRSVSVCQSPHQRFSSSTAPSSGGTREFILPDIGEGIVEVEVLNWHVKEGDEIKQFDKVCDVESDKATVTITSRFDGVVKSIEVPAGEMAHVGKPLVIFEGDGKETKPSTSSSSSSSQPPSSSPSSTGSSSTGSSSTSSSSSTGKVRATPAVRALAKKHAINLSEVSPTGKGGRIMKGDVLKFLEEGKGGEVTTAPVVEPEAVPIAAQPVPVVRAEPIAAETVGRGSSLLGLQIPTGPPTLRSSSAVEDKIVKISGLKRTMVKTMTESNKIPTFMFTDELNVSKLVEVRMNLKPVAEGLGKKLSFFPFILKATSLALSEFPILNSATNEDCSEIRQIGYHNIGIAMDTPKGLTVPVIHDIQDLTVLEIADELLRLQHLGENGMLGEKELKGGTFSLSNIGTIGGMSFTALIVPPQVAIGALGRMRTVPLYDADMNLQPTEVMGVSWSADHRVIDGATMARFHERWKFYVEDPNSMLLHTR